MSAFGYAGNLSRRYLRYMGNGNMVYGGALTALGGFAGWQGGKFVRNRGFGPQRTTRRETMAGIVPIPPPNINI